MLPIFKIKNLENTIKSCLEKLNLFKRPKQSKFQI